jgi:uncharacterized protein
MLGYPAQPQRRRPARRDEPVPAPRQERDPARSQTRKAEHLDALLALPKAQPTGMAVDTGYMRITIRVRPGSARPGVGGEHDGALVVRVSARAVDGKATEAALAAVAGSFGVRRSSVRLVSGASSRTKIVDIDAGDPRVLTSLLAAPNRLVRDEFRHRLPVRDQLMAEPDADASAVAWASIRHAAGTLRWTVLPFVPGPVYRSRL